MLKKLGCASVVALASVGLLVGPASGGELVGSMVADPNPATVGDTVTISNADDDGASTCQNGEGPEAPVTTHVDLELMAPDATTSSVEVTPDSSGEWSYEFTADQEGTYVANAMCLYDAAVEESLPAQIAPFDYVELTILVQGVPASSTTTTAASTTTAADAAPTATPRYTG